MEIAPVHVYNTLTKKKELFKTVVPGKVGMYLCGPTVYKPSHLGHMVGPVIFDTVKRYLQYLGYDVNFVVNITDVDDKLIVESYKQKTTVADLAERITADYVRNLELLNVAGIDHMPRATHFMADIVEIIEGLIAKGYAYAAGGDVYFDVTKDEDYGKLCHRDPEQLEAGARIEVSDKKHNPGDFALWKNAKPGEPFWDSPWGKGRPGWHIECSAMSMKLLGKTLDIHGGGLDLQFPHHENELAQSESYNEVTFVRYWMHNGLMKTGTEKMSKSKGNEIVVSELLKRHEPETLRFFLLATHYRRPIDYSEERLEEIRRGLDGFYRFFERFQRITSTSFYELKASARRRPLPPREPGFGVEVIGLWEKFLEHMDDDFNTGGAIGILYEMLTALNRFADTHQLEGGSPATADLAAFQRAAIIMKELTQILGFFHKAPPLTDAGQDKLAAGLMQLLIDLRAEARKTKNFALGDQIRKRLTELGVTLEDRPGERFGEWVNAMTRILGIDPGLQITGYGVVESSPLRPIVCEAGVIRSGDAKTNMALRILSVYNGIVEIIEQFHPSVLAVEQLYAHYQHPRTAILMGHARGTILLAAAQRGLEVVSYNATRVKKTITGNGRASKDQVQRTIQRELGLAKVPEPPDVADALAVALCHYYLVKLPGV